MGISFQNVDFSYYGYSKRKKYPNVLKDICVNISGQSEFVAIVGHTGSGKTTFTQLCNGLNLPTSGVVSVMDLKLTHKFDGALKPIRKKVGLVFQFPEYQLFEETVLKDVAFGPSNFGYTKAESIKLAKKYLGLVGLSEDLFERTPFTLSGGQMRKVAIAGILACEPDVLIFDEPTVGLDGKSKKELMNLLKVMNEEYHKTIIIVTHNMDVVAEFTKRVLVFNEGSIVCDKTPVELFNDSKTLAKYSLDLPEVSRLAVMMKEQGLIDFDQVPFTTLSLAKLLGGKYE